MMDINRKIIKVKGGVTAAAGFLANSVFCGIKKGHAGGRGKDRVKDDLALIYSEAPAVSVGFFTTNQVQAAPVKVCKDHLKTGIARAVIINSGNANCCTGKQGLETARQTARATACRLGLKETDVLPASTGIIGRQLPGDKICKALDELIIGLRPGLRAGQRAAQAIMTTDTRRKEAAVRIKTGRQVVTIGGMAKGSGMIAPNVATMLCFITTDAKISGSSLKQAGKQAMEESFNSITVDGDMSTNDTVLIMANGLSGSKAIVPGSAAYRMFCAGLNMVCCELARMIAADGEGARKLVEIKVTGSRTKAEARKTALAIANSNLVKTMIAGGDPNWGRVLSAAGAGGAVFNPEKVKLYFGRYCVYKNGRGQEVSLSRVKKELSGRKVDITVDLSDGRAEARVFTCDLTKEYIRINAEYST